jgi:serine/threonine-protein kinase
MRDTLPDDRLLDLLAKWEEAELQGQPIDLETLAADAPELLPELRRRVELLRGLERLGPATTDVDSTSPESRPGHDLPGGDLGRYEVLGEVARGGMGAVYRALDRQLNREVALKLMHRGREADPAMRLRFVEEAQLTGQLQHPGVPPVFERGETPEGRPYYTMRLVKGRTLAEMLGPDEDGPAAPGPPAPAGDLPRLLSAFEAICQAVAYAHGKGVVHRDLKPSNVMVGPFGEVQVMDWGLAKVLGDDGPEHRRGSIVRTVRTEERGSGLRTGTVGTPAYMPPEQAQGLAEHLDARADVFALGAILAKVLTGAPAYTGRTRDEVLRKALRGDLAGAYARLDACGADPELVSLARECLAAEPLDRPADAGEVAGRVGAYQASVAGRLREQELARAAAEARAGQEARLRALADELAEAARGRAAEADRRAAVERSRRTRTAALALAGLALVASLAGGVAYLARQRAAQHLRTARAVSEALAGADTAAGRAGGLAEPRAEAAAWAEALAQARRAEDALEAGLPTPEERARVEERLARFRGGLDRAEARVRDAEAERKLVQKLEEVRGRRAEHWDDDLADRDYAAAFREAGMDLDAAEPDEAAAWVAKREATEEIIAAIDEWCAIRRWYGTSAEDPPPWVRLNTIAMRADSDPWRNEIRRWFGRPASEAAAALDARFRDDEALARQPAASLVLLARLFSRAGERDKAAAVLKQAWDFYPGDFWVNYGLGNASWNTAWANYDEPKEAVRFLTAALVLRPRSVVAMSDLGTALHEAGMLDEAVEASRRATQLAPGRCYLHDNLGHVLRKQGKLEEAIVAYREAIRINPHYHYAHNGLGLALLGQGRYEEAIASYQEALKHEPDYHFSYYNLGRSYKALGRFDEAIASYREAIRLRPDYDYAINNLGLLVLDKGQIEEAIALFEEAVRLDPKDAMYRNNLGLALDRRGQVDRAISYYEQAIRLDPDIALAHYNLGLALKGLGRYAEAVRELRKGHELGSREPGWTYGSREALEIAERQVALAERLPGLLRGEDQPRDNRDRLAFAQMCYDRKLHARATRLWTEAFAIDPTLVEDPRKSTRYDAACSAALGGSGQAEDVSPTDETERAKLRDQALRWLTADLDAWEGLLESADAALKAKFVEGVDHSKRDADLAGVRDPDALERLPDDERDAWRALWARAAALREHAAKRTREEDGAELAPRRRP